MKKNKIITISVFILLSTFFLYFYKQLNKYQIFADTNHNQEQKSTIPKSNTDSLKGSRFVIYNHFWGHDVALQAEHMTSLSDRNPEIREKIETIRELILHNFSGQSSANSQEFLTCANKYFPHEFANFADPSEGWSEHCTGWLSNCNDNKHTQVNGLKGKGLVRVSLITEDIASLELPQISFFSSDALASEQIQKEVTNFADKIAKDASMKAITEFESKLNRKCSEIDSGTIISVMRNSIVRDFFKANQYSESPNQKPKIGWTYSYNHTKTLKFVIVLIAVEHFVKKNGEIVMQPIENNIMQMATQVGHGLTIYNMYDALH